MAARITSVILVGARACVPDPMLLGVLPFTPPPPPRKVTVWRPRIRPELRTMRERVIIYYARADLPVAAVLALAGWPVGDVL